MATYAEVYIWLPTTTTEYALGIGHGAVKIRTQAGVKHYITWLNGTNGSGTSSGTQGTFASQGTEASRQVGFAQIRNRKTNKIEENEYRSGSRKEISFKQDRQKNLFRFPEAVKNGQREKLPNFSFALPVLEAVEFGKAPKRFGVSVNRMAKYWTGLLNSKPGDPRRRYAMLSTKNNCNGVVVQALLAGGLGMFATPPKNLIYQDARTLVKWVEKARDRIVEMNEQRESILQLIEKLPRNSESVRAIPTPEQWKKDSDKGIFILARRKDQIAQLDMLIKFYHRAVRENHRVAEVNVLLAMQHEIYSHLTQKPKSDRRQAVLELAQKVEWVLNDLLVKHDHEQSDDSLNSESDREFIGLGN